MASKIKNTYPQLYDIFSIIAKSGSYIPNKRFRNLLHENYHNEITESKILRLSSCIQMDLNTSRTYRPVPDGSEIKVVRPNLESMLSAALKISGYDNIMEKATQIFECGNILANKTQSEPCIAFKINTVNKSHFIPIICSEAKGEEDSSREANSQIFTITGGSAIQQLYLLGLNNIENVAVPAISLSGDGFKVLGVYLVNDSFPILAELTRIMDPIEESQLVAIWLLKLLEFSKETITLLQNAASSYTENINVEAVLKFENHFFKPLRDTSLKVISVSKEKVSSQSPTVFQQVPISSSSESLPSPFTNLYFKLHRIMKVYKRLDAVESSYLYVLFPRGLLMGPAWDVIQTQKIRETLDLICKIDFPDISILHRPIIIYERLTWKNTRPKIELIESYLFKLRLAVDILNKANVAHLDLRPANIMWREVDSNSIEMKLIDFEDAQMFGFTIPNSFVNNVVSDKDYRYPFVYQNFDSDLAANQEHNEFYILLLTKWLRDFQNVEDFDAYFMQGSEDVKIFYDDTINLLGL